MSLISTLLNSRRCASFFLGCLLFSCSDGATANRPNILLVTFDTTRVDALGCYGGPAGVSPTIDAFASRGVRFTSAYSSAPLTLPAHSSLLTGHYPDEHGVRANNSYALPAEELTLAEVLQEEGYSTAAFVASYVLERQFGLAQGFEHYDDDMDSSLDDIRRVGERSADQVTDRLLDWLGEQPADTPFFIWLHYYDPHFPHELHPSQTSRFDSVYLDEVAFADAQLARVRGALESEGRLDQTLVVLTADHGEGQGEHNESTHGYFLYQGTQHIPLILSHPSLPQGSVLEGASSLVDVMPTVLGFLGLDPPPTSGRDLLTESPDATGRVYMEAELGRIDFGLSPLRGVFDGAFKLINTPAPELYDLSTDPQENENLASQELERVSTLQAWLSDRKARPAANATHRPASDATARIRALGYTGGSSDTEVAQEIWSSPQLARWSQLSNEGMRRFQSGELALAIKALEQLVEECPQAYAGQLYLGLGLVNTGETERGLAHLERAVQLQPQSSAEAWWNLAMGSALAGKPAKARKSLEKVLEIEPKHVRALQKLSEMALQGRDAKRARQYLRILVESSPQSAEGRWAADQLRRLIH